MAFNLLAKEIPGRKLSKKWKEVAGKAGQSSILEAERGESFLAEGVIQSVQKSRRIKIRRWPQNGWVGGRQRTESNVGEMTGEKARSRAWFGGERPDKMNAGYFCNKPGWKGKEKAYALCSSKNNKVIA